jgi:hypothetical protein
MKALRVHGGGAVFARTSCSVGRRGQYGPAGIDRLRGLEGANSPDDMKPSSSASQSERTDEQRVDVSLDSVGRCSEGGFRFDLRIALRRYFMGTRVERPSCSPTTNGTPNNSKQERFPKFSRRKILYRSTVIVRLSNTLPSNAFVEGRANWAEASSKRSCLSVCFRWSDPTVACGGTSFVTSWPASNRRMPRRHR